MKVDKYARAAKSYVCKCESPDSRRHVEANSVHKIIQNNKMPSLSQCSFAPPSKSSTAFESFSTILGFKSKKISEV